MIGCGSQEASRSLVPPCWMIRPMSPLGADRTAPPSAGPLMPRGARWSVFTAVTSLVLGAVYLVVVRGDALMLDLSGLSRFMFCF